MSDHVPDLDVQYVGPFERTEVVVEGRLVPFLDAQPLDGGRVDLTLDSRFGLVLTVEEAERVVPFLAHAIAIGLGYTSHPSGKAEPNPRHPFPRVTGLMFLGEQGDTDE